MYQNGTQAYSSEPGGSRKHGDIVVESIHILLQILLSGMLTDLGQKASPNLFCATSTSCAIPARTQHSQSTPFRHLLQI